MKKSDYKKLLKVQQDIIEKQQKKIDIMQNALDGLQSIVQLELGKLSNADKKSSN